MVSRLYKAHPSQGNRYYLRLLLLHQTHVIDWKSLKRVHGVFYDTYREACDALGLLKDDEEWKHCLEDAARSQSANLVYNLFLTILTQCHPDNPAALWEEYKMQICEKFFLKKNYKPLLATDEQIAECLELGLQQIKADLGTINPEKSNGFYDLPEPENYAFHGMPQIILKERNYDQEVERLKYEENYEKLNTDAGTKSQKQVPIFFYRFNLLFLYIFMLRCSMLWYNE